MTQSEPLRYSPDASRWHRRGPPPNGGVILGKWLFRSTILLGIAGLVGVVWLYHTWTDPEVVRRLILEQLRDRFEGVEVRLESARLRLLGGISFEDLALTRRDDATATPFLTVPSGRIYHDKERLAAGELVVRKVEYDQPVFRLQRRADGTWNVADVLKPIDPAEPTPSLVVREGTILLIDETVSPTPLETLTGVSLTMVNDPVSQVTFHFHGQGELLGTLTVDGQLNRTDGAGLATVELPEIVVGTPLLERVAPYLPAEMTEWTRLEGRASLRTSVAYRPQSPSPIQYDARLTFRDGRLDHPRLPVPLQGVGFTVTCQDGHLKLEQCRANSGDCSVSLDLAMALMADEETSSVSEDPAQVGIEQDLPPELQRRLHRLDLTVEHLMLTPNLFDRLPPKLQGVEELFSPSGPINLTYGFERDGDRWTKSCTVRPQGIHATYADFRYPLEQLNGKLELTVVEGEPERLDVDLTGLASGRPISIEGTICGEGPAAGMQLRLYGTEIPFNERLIEALPSEHQQLARDLNIEGVGNIDIDLKQEINSFELHSRFEVRPRDISLYYKLFPYPLERVSGLLVIIPPVADTREMAQRHLAKVPESATASDQGVIELHGVTAAHKGATVRLDGRKAPSKRGATFTLRVLADNAALDDELRHALEKVNVADIWDELAPEGRANLGARITIHDLAPDGTKPDAPPDVELPFDPISCLEVSLNVNGGTITPSFFPTRMTSVSGRMDYHLGKIDLTGWRAWTGETAWSLSHAEIRPHADGGFWSDARNLIASPLVPGPQLNQGLPAPVAKMLQESDLQGGLQLHLHRVVVDDPDAPKTGGDDPPATIYWDGLLYLNQTSLDAGVECTQIVGQLGCQGRYEGDRFGRVIGNLILPEARIAKLPVQDLGFRFTIDPDEPDILQIPIIQAKLFGGELGGEARLHFAEPLMYDLKLNALGVRLDHLAQQHQLGPDVELEGAATGQLFLTNRPETPGGEPFLRGGGNIDVPAGRMLNLPVFLDLLKVLNLRAPDSTAFEEAHAIFTIEGERMSVTQLDLLGNAISLGGEGELNLDGTETHFEFYTIWSRLLKDWLTSPVGDLSAAMSKELFKIEVTGTLGSEMDYRKVAVPLIVDPFQRAMERMRSARLPRRWMQWALE